MAHSMTPELRLIVAPARTYALLARQPSPVGPFLALRRPLLAAVVLGVSIAIAATRHVTPALVLNTTIAWSFVVVLQIVIALLLIAGPSRRSVGVPRALDLFFASHAPWSFFLLGAAALPAPLGRPLAPVLLLAVVAFALTVRAIAAFFREVLHLDSRRALVRTVLHQAITWTAFVVLYGSAVALRPRIVGWLGW
jgi:hypothetical protein